MPAGPTLRSSLLRPIQYAALTLLIALTAACGGSGSGDSDTPPQDDPPANDNGGNGENGDEVPGDNGNGDDDGSGSDTGDDDGTDITPPEDIELRDGLTLGAEHAEPMTQVPVEGLDEDDNPADFYIQFWVVSGDIEGLDDDGEARILPLVRLDGEDFVVAPLLDDEGAQIKLQITDGEQGSALQSLQISALPRPRDGALATLEQAVEDTLRETTEALGKDYPDEWEHWRDHEMNGMPEYLFPLMTTWQQFFDSQNDDAWVNQSFDEDTQILLERMLAQAPVIEAFQGQSNFVASGESALNRAPEIGMAGLASQQQHAQSAHMLQSAQSPTNWELESLIQINDAYELQNWVEQYQSARRTQRDIELFDDTVGSYLSMVATIGSLPSGAAGATVISAKRRAAIESFTNAMSAMANASGISMWFLPCCEFEMEVALDPEDGLITDEDEPDNQIALGSALGHIQSPGVDLTRQLVGGVVSELGDLADTGINKVAEQYLGNVTTTLIDDWGGSQMAETFMNQFPDGAQMIFHWRGIDLVTDDPHQWLIAEPDTFGGGTPIIEQATEQGADMEFALVTPAAFFREDSQIRFRTDYDDIEADAAVDTTDVFLNHIDVRFDPPRIELEGDEDGPIPFKVIVENTRLSASDEKFIERPLELDRDDMGEVEFVLATGDNEIYFEYHPPEELPSGENILTIGTKSMSEDGIRGDSSAPERSGTLFVTTEAQDVRINPQATCLEPDETQQFEAKDPLTGEAISVDWSATAGDIDANGLFTAQDGDETATITAQIPETGRSDDVTIFQGSCACSWQAVISGDQFATEAEAGNLVALSLIVEEGAYSELHISNAEDSGNIAYTTNLRFDLEPPIPFGGEGPTTRQAQPHSLNIVRGVGFELSYDQFTQTLPPLSVTIHERGPVEHPLLADGDYEDALPDGAVQMSGQISGMVSHPSLFPNMDTFSQLDLSFSGSFWFDFGNNLNCEPLE